MKILLDIILLKIFIVIFNYSYVFLIEKWSLVARLIVHLLLIIIVIIIHLVVYKATLILIIILIGVIIIIIFFNLGNVHLIRIYMFLHALITRLA